MKAASTRRRRVVARKKWCRECRRDLFERRCHNVYCGLYRVGDRLRYKAGSRVVVKGFKKEGERLVEMVYSDVDGGRRLDRPVDGFVSWNVDDLVGAPKRRQRGRR